MKQSEWPNDDMQQEHKKATNRVSRNNAGMVVTLNGEYYTGHLPLSWYGCTAEGDTL